MLGQWLFGVPWAAGETVACSSGRLFTRTLPESSVRRLDNDIVVFEVRAANDSLIDIPPEMACDS